MFSNSKNNIRIHCKKAVVLAAGEGKRLRPATLNTPKPLIEVNGQKIPIGGGKTEAEAVELLVQKAKRSATIPGGSTSGTRGIRNAVRSGYAYQRRKKLANF